MAGEPGADLVLLVRGVVVEDDVDGLVRRHLALDAVEEADELLMAVALHVLCDDRTVQHVERGEQRRRAMAAKWFHLPLANIPANAAFLRKKFGDLHPCHTGAAKRPVSAPRIQNVKSLIWAAMREASLSTKLLPYGAKKLPEWQALFDLLDGRYLRTELSCFMGFCSNQKIKPSEVDDAVMDGFLEALERESPKKHPRTSHQTTCRTWNMAANEVPGWPPVKVTVPRYDTRKYAISDDLVHPDLSAAISNYLSKLAGEKLFGGPKKPFRPSSLKSTKGNIHRSLPASPLWP